MQSGVTAGGITASATAGALVAIGKRLGGASLPFEAIGRALSGAGASLAGSSPGTVVLGMAVHLAVTTFWAVVCVRLAMRWRGHVIVAVVATTAAWLSASSITARLTGHGLATLLPLGDRVVLALVFALSLAVGIRLAFLVRE